MTDQTVTFTRLESIALQCAVRAVIDSAPAGSPGTPLLDALHKLERPAPTPSPAPNAGSQDGPLGSSHDSPTEHAIYYGDRKPNRKPTETSEP